MLKKQKFELTWIGKDEEQNTKDALIGAIKQRLKQKATGEEFFKIRWKVV